MPRRNRTPPEVTKEHFQASLARVQAASRRLQNATEVRNEEAWPTPSKSAPEIDQLTYEANVAMLEDAIQDCRNFGVDVNRKSANGEVLDSTVTLLKKRKVKGEDKDEKEKEVATKVEEKEKGKKKQKETTEWEEMTPAYIMRESPQQGKNTSELDGVLRRAGSEVMPIVIQDSPSARNKSGKTFRTEATHELGKVSTSATSQPANQDKSGGVVIHAKGRDDPVSINARGTMPEPSLLHSLGDHSMDIGPNSDFHLSRNYLRFPDPHKMAGSFTDAVCQYENLTVKPILALTFRDVTPLMHLPNRERCILLKHFEVGLDSVEGLVAGEVVIPESPFWRKHVREDRLGKLGTLKIGSGGHSKELEDHQRRCRYGEGRWIFFGIKFRQSLMEMKKGKGKWCCFGAPLEAIQRFDAVEEQIPVGGGENAQGGHIPIHTETFFRTNIKLSSGGVPCMDLWEGAKDWDGGLWVDVYKAMANNCLVVNTLYQTREQKGMKPLASSSKTTQQQHDRCSPQDKANARSPNPISRMDGAAESQVERKRKCSVAAETPGKSVGCKKSKSRPLEEDEINVIREMLAKQRT